MIRESAFRPPERRHASRTNSTLDGRGSLPGTGPTSRWSLEGGYRTTDATDVGRGGETESTAPSDRSANVTGKNRL
ncbi:hypothetical protein OB955_15585 [Halobacteria archaeon AArc-m2/3/4]|uniref:Uncharacterized protein n=1 Tax=Natronoglomus mannanivorans TaxID=2979990 RepID=A0AAP3E366_9EURY|nr:hypothetical protein [Halobacteria archaeon AArc-xg1-1]MCU4974151.1 hypothetical protein [Halobacteria archaeon AArc-m2/3/4]